MSCGPCKETPECVEIDDEENDVELKALTDLFNRLFESKRAATGRPAEDCNANRTPRPRDQTSLWDETPASSKKPPAAAEYCDENRTSNGSPMTRADRLLTTLLRRHSTARNKDGDDDDGGDGNDDATATAQDPAAEGDVTHLTAGLPKFRSCKNRKPGTVNATLFGLDLERQITGAGTPGDGRDDDVKRAAYDLAAAEARCKHAGAVEAAEMAVYIEPAGHLAEMAARFGAQSQASDGLAGSGTGQAAGGDSPVVVVAYVGNTAATSETDD